MASNVELWLYVKQAGKEMPRWAEKDKKVKEGAPGDNYARRVLSMQSRPVCLPWKSVRQAQRAKES